MNYAKAIRIARAARGLTGVRLAALSDLNPSYISLIESGKRKPSETALVAIARALRTPRELLDLLATEERDVSKASAKDVQRLGKDLLELRVSIPDGDDRED